MLKLELQNGEISIKLKFKWNEIKSLVKIQELKGWRNLEENLISCELGVA